MPLQAPDRAAEELRHAVTSLGMVGVEIATTVDGRELDDPELAPFWSAAEELRAVVVVHPYASLAGRDVSRYNLDNLVGNPAETTHRRRATWCTAACSSGTPACASCWCTAAASRRTRWAAGTAASPPRPTAPRST